MTNHLQFSAGIRTIGKFDFTLDVPNKSKLTRIQLAEICELMKDAVITQWDTFDENKTDSIEQVLGRCLRSIGETDVANTTFYVDLFWCLEGESAREVADTMGIKISEDFLPEAWVKFNVEFHSILGRNLDKNLNSEKRFLKSLIR
jgi:superfamily I DNA/RNA helicase